VWAQRRLLERDALDGQPARLHGRDEHRHDRPGPWRGPELEPGQQHSKGRGRLLQSELLPDAVARAGQEGHEGVRRAGLVPPARPEPPGRAEGVRLGPDGRVAVRGEDVELQHRAGREGAAGDLEPRGAGDAGDQGDRGPEAEGLLEHGGDALEAAEGVKRDGPGGRARAEDAGELVAEEALLLGVAGELVDGPGEEAAGGVFAGEEEGAALVDDE
jgi:hypothetical protein